jgi:CRP/FNR family cyclic AMP-dependent transcriptional regulator
MPVKRFDPSTFLAKIDNGRTATIHDAGEIIFRQGEPAATVFYLQRGSVKETVTSGQGKETTVGVLEPGQFFGTSGLDGATARVSSTRAMAKSTTIAVTNAAMRAALENEPGFSLMFVGWLLRHSTQIEAEKLNLLFNKSEKRLAQMLLLLARAADGPPRTISTAITQDMLADMISTTRPRVNLFLRKFRRLGLIEYSGGIRVNQSRLAAVLDEDKVRP